MTPQMQSIIGVTMEQQKCPLLTVMQFADRTGWKVSTVRKKILRREIAYVKLGRSIRIQQSVLDALIESGFRPAITYNSGELKT